MSRSGSDSDNFDEEQEVGRFTIQPYQFEPRVDSDEADSNSDGDQLSDDEETANPGMQNSDWYVMIMYILDLLYKHLQHSDKLRIVTCK